MINPVTSGVWRLTAMGCLIGLLGCTPPLIQPDVGAEALASSGLVVATHAPEGVDGLHMDGGPLTLDRAVRIAVEHEPRIQAALSLVRESRAEATQARLLPNPILTLSVRFREGGGDPVFDAGLAGDLVLLLQRKGKVSAADNRMRQSAADALAVVLDVIDETQEAFATVLSLEEELAFLRERRGLTEKLTQLGRARLKAGEAANLDVITLESQQLTLDVEIADKEQERVEARLLLARLLGQPGGDLAWVLQPVQRLGQPDAAEGLWIEAALRYRPEVRSRTWLLAALGDEIAISRLAILEGADGGVQTEWDQDWTTGPSVSTPIPLFDWGTARREKAAGALSEARHQMTQLQRQIVQEVRTQYAASRAAIATEKLAREQLLPRQEERSNLTQRMYRAGEIDVSALLLAEEEMVDTRLKLVALRRKASIARLKLERAVGGSAVAARLAGTGKGANP